MLFSFSSGSKGKENNDTFSIFVPLVLSSGNEIKIEDGSYEESLGGYRCLLEKHHYQFSLKVEGFSTEEECREFIEKLRVGISWFILKRTTGIRCPSEVSELHFFDSPLTISDGSEYKSIADHMGWSEVDGTYNADQLVIFQEKLRLIRFEMGKVSAKLSYNPSGILADIDECLNLEGIDQLLEARKLQVAVDLYSAFKFETTTTGRFVKLVTVLEALLPEGEISSDALQALNVAKLAIKSHRKELAKSGAETKDVDRLLSRVGNLKYSSIGSNLENHLREVLEMNSNLGKTEELIPKIREIYNARSSLLHSGVYDEQAIQDYLSVLSDLIPGILKSYYGIAE